MKRRKKITAVLLIIFSIMTSVPVQAQEIADVRESIDAVGTDYLTSEDGLYKYELKTIDGETCVYLEEYEGMDVNVEIPEVIDGYTVRGILLTTLFPNNYTLETLKLPKTITSVAAGAFVTTYALKSFSIDTTSKSGFYTEDGILYCGNKLVAYPAAKEGETYILPKNVNSIMREAFYGCSNLKRVVISEFVGNISRGAFTRCTAEMEIILKKTSFSDMYISDLNYMCWDMALGTKILVKNEELKAEVLTGMTRTNVYKDSTDTMAVEVMQPTPATTLTFSDGTTEAWVQASYTDTGYTGDPVNNFYLQSLYQQEPYDTTDNVTWSLVSADTCPAILNEKNPDKYVCQVTPGGTIITYAGGNAVLKGTDESGHELILHVAVYSPMETFEVKGRSGPSVKAGEEAVVYADITPEYSYANNVKVTWTSSNPEVATVETYGTVTAKINGLEAGYTTLTATVNDNGKLISKTLEVSVFDYITNCTVDPIPAQTYLGEQLKPVPVVRYHGRILTEGIDYEVVYYGDNCAIGKQEGYMCINGLNTTFARTVKTLNVYFDIIDGRSNPSGVNPIPGTGENQNPSNNTGSSHTPSTGDPNTASNDPEQGNGTDTAIKTFQAKNIKYTVTSAKEVKVTGATKKSIRSVTIPATVKYKGTTYKVTSIGSKAFYNCKKLKTVTIKSRKLKSVGKSAFKGIYKKAKVTVPKSKYKAYRKLLKKAGFSSKTVWKKK